MIEITIEDFKLIKSFYPEFTRAKGIRSNRFIIDWNGLMPVVEKIENELLLQVDIHTAYTNICGELNGLKYNHDSCFESQEDSKLNIKDMNLLRERIKEAERRFKKPVGEWVQVDLSKRPHPSWMTRSFSNNRYIVMIDDKSETTAGPAIRAMIQTVHDRPILNHWSELQKIKNELFGEEVTAIEYYPKESELVNQHNIYWLWIFPDGVIPTMLKK